MPDLQTEIFRKVLPNLNNIKFDDPDEVETPMPVATEPVTTEPVALTRQVFAYINANPKCTGKQVLNHFTDAGHNRAVVASTITYLIDTKRAERVDGRLVTLRAKYERPKKSTKATAPKQKPETIKPREPDAWSVDAVLNGLTMYQGRALYNTLKEIYGG